MRIIGRPRVLFAVLASCLVLAGCGSGPSRVGAAVIVGDQSVSVDDVQAKLDKLLQDNPLAKSLAQQHKLDLLSRSIVSREVLNRATDDAAKSNGLVVDQQQIAQRAEALRAQRSAAQPAATDGQDAGVSQATDAAFDVNETARYQQIQSELATKYLKTYEVVRDSAIVADGNKAQELGKAIAADPAKAADLIKALSADEGQDFGGGPVPLTLLSGLIDGLQQGYQLATSAVFGVGPNTVVAFPMNKQAISQEVASTTAWYVALVRTTDMNAKVTPAQEQQLAQAQVPDQFLVQIGERLVGASVSKLNVQINPRYGVWDVVANGLAPRTEELAGYTYPARVTAMP